MQKVRTRRVRRNRDSNHRRHDNSDWEIDCCTVTYVFAYHFNSVYQQQSPEGREVRLTGM